MGAGALAHAGEFRAGAAVAEDSRVQQRVVEDNVRRPERLNGSEGQQTRVTGARADERDRPG
jgi:hypothetical protein